MAAPSTSSSSTTNIMLAIFEKKTTSVDLYHPLYNYISFNYSECEAQNLEDNLQTLKQYRSDLERQPDPTPTSCRDLLQNYFKALYLVKTRFLISLDKDHINTITFTWNDAFHPYPPTVTNSRNPIRRKPQITLSL
ncbi:vacuolar-sorting protein BRO1 isoform X2 [Fagus crenata]